MSDPTPKQNRFHGIPGVVVVSLLAALLAAVVAYDLGVNLSYLISIGVALLVGATGTMISPTLQDLGRRQSRLALTAAEADPEDPTQITAPHLPPWPVDAGRVVANEIAEAQASLEIAGSASGLSMVSADLLAVRPSKEAHDRARERFKELLSQHANELRDWLAGYAEAALVRSETFEVTLRLANGSPSVHADDVTVVLDLPATVAEAGESPTFDPPPERPIYQPPRPRSLGGMGFDRPYLSPSALAFDPLPKVPSIDLSKVLWEASVDGRRLQATVGEVHAGRSVGVADPLLLHARGAGRHEIRWRAYTKSARRASEGVLTLVVPARDPAQPAIGRLGGMTSYPDVDLVDEDTGDVGAAARTSDPPPRPPDVPEGSDIVDRLEERHALMKWLALGLDPATDGAMPVGEVRRVSAAD